VKVLLLIGAMAAITFACRALPLIVLVGRPLSEGALGYLRYLPMGVLAAVAAISVWPQGRSVDVPFAAGVALAALVALRTGNLLATLLGAMAMTAFLRVVLRGL
jgi:branched-subunit amino acid transport protein